MNSHSASPSATAAGSAFALSGAYSDYLGPAVPDSWRAALDKALSSGEKVLASLSLDLDARLQFRPGLVALTNSRLMAWDAATQDWQSWPYREGMQLRHRDHAGALLDAIRLIDEGVDAWAKKL
mgnify:CR=1 FL=1